ncbi:MAG: hypothetical protein R3Y67_04230 [Eubacteriales bacterium]
MVKCKHCGSQLNIELEYCTFCKAENPYFKKHREDMEAYQEEFDDALTKVHAHTRKMTRITSSVIIISVLIVLNICVFTVNNYSYQIQTAINRTIAEMNSEHHREQLLAYEAEEEFFTLSTYYYDNSLYRVEELKEFDVLMNVIQFHEFIFNAVTSAYVNGEGLSASEISGIAWYIEELYDSMEYSEYEAPEAYDQIHMNAMEKIIEDTEALLLTYTPLAEEDVEQLDTYDEIQLIVLLSGGSN